MKIQPSFARKTRTKYGAKKTQVGEVQFDSKKGSPALHGVAVARTRRGDH